MQFVRLTLVLLLSTLFVSACGSSTAPSAPVDPNSIGATLAAMHFQTQTAAAARLPTFPPVSPVVSTPPFTMTGVPTASPTLALLPSATYGPTFTPSVTGTVFTPTIDPTLLASGCNNLAFIIDVNVPPGTQFKPGEEFGKTWKVANTGTCNWLYRYALTPVGGDLLGGATTIINRIVVPDHWAEVSVGLRAPDATGTYTGYWRMADVDGNLFGATLVVKIKVSTNPTDTPEPTDTEAPSPTATSTP